MFEVDEWSRAQLLLEKAREAGAPLSEVRLIDVDGCGDVLPEALVPTLTPALREIAGGSTPEVVRSDLPLTVDQAAFLMRVDAAEVTALISMELLPGNEVEGVTFVEAGCASKARDQLIFDSGSVRSDDERPSRSSLTKDRGRPDLPGQALTADAWRTVGALLEKRRRASQRTSTIRLVGPDGTSHLIPDGIISVIRSAARELLLDNQHTVVRSDLRLTFAQAALSLRSSEAVIEKLVERGRLHSEDWHGLRLISLGDAISCCSGVIENNILKPPEELRRRRKDIFGNERRRTDTEPER